MKIHPLLFHENNERMLSAFERKANNAEINLADLARRNADRNYTERMVLQETERIARADLERKEALAREDAEMRDCQKNARLDRE